MLNGSIQKKKIENVQTKRQEFQAICKNRNILHSLMKLSPILSGRTGWPGMYDMVQAFNRIRTELEVAAADGLSLFIENDARFRVNRIRLEVQ